MNVDKADPEAVLKKNIETAKSISELLAGNKTERMKKNKAERAAARQRRTQERLKKKAQRAAAKQTGKQKQQDDKRESTCEGFSCTVQLQMGLSKHLGQPLMW